MDTGRDKSATIDPDLELIPLETVQVLTGGRSKSAIYADPTFPAPVAFTEPGRIVRRARWLKHEVVAWLRERIARRDAMADERRRLLIAAQERKRAKRKPVRRRADEHAS